MPRRRCRCADGGPPASGPRRAGQPDRRAHRLQRRAVPAVRDRPAHGRRRGAARDERPCRAGPGRAGGRVAARRRRTGAPSGWAALRRRGAVGVAQGRAAVADSTSPSTDVPLGRGLVVVGGVECAVAPRRRRDLRAWDSDRRARPGCARAENDVRGRARAGGMDQMASLHCAAGTRAAVRHAATAAGRQVPFDAGRRRAAPPGDRHEGASTRSRTGSTASAAPPCEKAAEALELRSLRDARPSATSSDSTSELSAGGRGTS